MNTSDICITEISKRDTIFAFAKRNTEIKSGRKVHKISEGQEIKGIGHWSTEHGVRMNVTDIGFERWETTKHVNIDTILLYEDWDIGVMVRCGCVSKTGPEEKK